jgi:hypothetical protein
VAIGALCFAVTFLVLERRQGHDTNVAGYIAVGTLLVIEGMRGLAPVPLCSMLWAGLALAAAWPAAAERRWALRAAVAVMALAAAVGSGLAGASLRAVIVPDAPSFPDAGYVVLALGVAAYLIMQRRAPVDDPSSRKALSFSLPGFCLALVVVVGAAGALVLAVAPLVAGHAEEADLGALAALRTIVMTMAILLLAWLGRIWSRAELIWATYLLLGLAPTRIVVDDLPHGRPATLFLTLVAFGIAIILAPRLIRKTAKPSGPE